MRLKRLAAPKTYWVKRKQGTWVAKSMPGPHKADESVPLVVLLRDLLKIVRNASEASKVLNKGKVLVDGLARKNLKHPVGFMDIISIPSIKKYYRVGFDFKGRVKAEPLSKNDSNSKLVKVINKIKRKNDYQIVTHDGRTIIIKLSDGKKIKTHDTLLIKIPSQEVIKHLSLKDKCSILIKGGKHKGETAVVKKINDREVVLKTKDDEFMLKKGYAFVIGD